MNLTSTDDDDDDDAFYLFLQEQKIALETYTLPPGTPRICAQAAVFAHWEGVGTETSFLTDDLVCACALACECV